MEEAEELQGGWNAKPLVKAALKALHDALLRKANEVQALLDSDL